MYFSPLVLAVFVGCISSTLSSATPKVGLGLERRATEVLASPGLHERDWKNKCKQEDIHFRREWRTLSKAERRSYIDAVLCLRKKPALYKEVNGAKSRFDDFQAVHINQTFIIHFDAQFLAWHRWFIWTYEQALKNECGYKGTHPYWDWTLDSSHLEASLLFDGSEYSMSGNGAFVKNQTNFTSILNIPGTPPITVNIPPGTGGDCVTTGPFANIQVPFGEVGPNISGANLNNPDNLAYKPHCLRRNLNSKVSGPSLTQANVEYLLRTPNITAFNAEMNNGHTPGVIGLHPGGHFGVGGDLTDTFSSPGDPIFYLHHAQVDRLWTLWQKINPATRQYAISGTGTFFNYPPSPEFKLNDTISLGKLSPDGSSKPIRDFMDTVSGPFCYQYL